MERLPSCTRDELSALARARRRAPFPGALVLSWLTALACSGEPAAPERDAAGPAAQAQAHGETAPPGANSSEPRGRSAPAAPALTRAAELAIAARVDETRALRRVRELVALGPRMGGTHSGDRAAEYRVEAFGEARLEARVVLDLEKWCHEEEAWRVVVHAATAGEGGAEPVVLASAWPYGFSPSAEGRARLLLDDARAPEGRPFARLAKRAPRARQGEPQPLAVLVDGSTTLDGSYPAIGHLRPGDANPYPVFGLSRGDGELLRARLAAGEELEVEVSLTARIRRARPKTVIATLPARAGAPAGHLLFSAHGDSDAGGPGADDNASGEATLLEIATAWKAAIDAGLAPAPAREVRFAIWGSEIHSSRGYLADDASREDLLAVINYDQAGFGSGADQLHVEPDDLPANVELVEVVVRVLRDHAGTPGFPARWVTNKSLGGTDSYVFSDDERLRAARRPAITLFASAWDRPAEHPRTPGMPGESWQERDRVAVDYDLYYHSAGDTPENTTEREPWNIGWCARVGALSAARWLEGRGER